MAFDLMRFLGGVNAYNTGQPIRGPSGSRGPILDLFQDREEGPFSWRTPGTVPTPEERARYEEGLDKLASELPPLPNRGGADGFGNPEIVVQNRPPATAVPGEPVEQAAIPSPPSLGNQDWLLEAQAAQENRPERKGMFGMKGTLRDVVGILGDAFLVQGGGKAMYLPQRQLERKSDAIVGMTAGMDRTDPATAAYLNAIERMAYEDPAAAEEMLKGFETRQLNQAVKENQIAQRTEATQKTRLGNITAARAQLQRILRNTRPELRAQAAAYYGPLLARQAGVPVEELGVRSGMTPEDYDAFARSDMNVYQTETLQDRDAQIAIAKQNADANTTRANRPPAQRSPSREGISNVDAEVARKVLQGTATPEEKKYYEERLKRGGGKTNRFQTGGASAPAVKPSLRVRNVRPAN